MWSHSAKIVGVPDMDVIVNGIKGSLIAIVAIILVSYFFKCHKWFKTPGPIGVLVFGYLPFLRKKDPHIQLNQLAKKYGEIYGINLCGQMYIHLSSMKAAREVFINQADCFSGKPEKYGLLNDAFEGSLAFVNGERWRVLRKFFVQSMNQVGLGAKPELQQGPLLDALKNTLNALKKSNNEPVELISLLTENCIASVQHLFLGDMVTKEESQQLRDAFIKFLKAIDGPGSLLYGNVAKYLVLPFHHKYKEMSAAKRDIQVLLNSIIERHVEMLDEDNPKDLIDLYLIKRNSEEREGDYEHEYFTRDALLSTMMQAYGDGSSGIGILIASMLKEMSHHVDVQDKVHKEIMEEIGSEKYPSWEDKSLLPYTIATIKETFRSHKLFPLIPGLECSKDTVILGVPVPKGSITIMNIWSIHHDPNVYKNPNDFDPSRFLPNESEELKITEQPVIFGIGRRACAGEQLVMAEIFTFFTAILRDFTILPTDESKEDENILQNTEDSCNIRAILRPTAA